MKQHLLLITALFSVCNSFTTVPRHQTKQVSFLVTSSTNIIIRRSMSGKDDDDETVMTTAAASMQDMADNSIEEQQQVKCPNCDLCDGSGRIAGGIGAVISWIPIKAYRPCPNFIENGGQYTRTGQSLDEIAFGRANRIDLGDKE